LGIMFIRISQITQQNNRKNSNKKTRQKNYNRYPPISKTFPTQN
jgi:hypothetical protein